MALRYILIGSMGTLPKYVRIQVKEKEYSIYTYRTGEWKLYRKVPKRLEAKYIMLRMVDIGAEIPGVGSRTGEDSFNVEV